jgi:aarF domain-containing kinase
MKTLFSVVYKSQGLKKYSNEPFKYVKKPGNIKRFLKFTFKSFIFFEVFSLTTSKLFQFAEPGSKPYLILSPYVQPFDVFTRVQRSTFILAYLYAKHILSEKYYSGVENEKEILSDIYQRNAQDLLSLFNRNGGVYRKLGQEIASMRDFLPDEYCDTLSQLFDQVPSEDFDSIKYIFQQDFNSTVEELFLEFDKTPLAAASLAQVHRAVTKEGKEVAVKIQYPRVQFYYTGDIFTQRIVSKFLEYFHPRSHREDLEEIRETLAKELNFVEESKNALETKENFKNNSSIYIPDVEQELTSGRILTMEFIHGIKGNDIEKMKKEGISLTDVANKLFGAIAEQTFTFGFLHSDMHGGNFLVRKNPNNLSETQVVLIDHGLYNRMSEEFRIGYCKFWKALVLRDDKYIEEYCENYGIVDSNFYTSMILMQGFDKVGPGPIEDFDNLGKKMTISKRKQFFDSMGGLTEMQEKMDNMMKKMPLEMLLIMRTSFLLRSVNQVIQL